AVALAQETDLVLLDEPTTYLDLAHQIEVLDIIRSLDRREGRTVVAVLHDLNLACRYADHLIALRSGRIVAEGPPARVMTPDVVEHVFGLRARILPDPLTGTPLVLPIPAAAEVCRVDDAEASPGACENGRRAAVARDPRRPFRSARSRGRFAPRCLLAL